MMCNSTVRLLEIEHDYFSPSCLLACFFRDRYPNTTSISSYPTCSRHKHPKAIHSTPHNPNPPNPFVQAAFPRISNPTSPSSPSLPPSTFPASHSLPSPLPLHFKSLSSFSRPPLSHFCTSASLNPASRNRAAPLMRQAARSRRVSREVDQGSSLLAPAPSVSESERATSARGL